MALSFLAVEWELDGWIAGKGGWIIFGPILMQELKKSRSSHRCWKLDSQRTLADDGHLASCDATCSLSLHSVLRSDDGAVKVTERQDCFEVDDIVDV